MTCRRVGDTTQLVASGVVSSSGDTTHYVNLQVRFVDSNGVRVELARRMRMAGRVGTQP